MYQKSQNSCFSLCRHLWASFPPIFHLMLLLVKGHPFLYVYTMKFLLARKKYPRNRIPQIEPQKKKKESFGVYKQIRH